MNEDEKHLGETKKEDIQKLVFWEHERLSSHEPSRKEIPIKEQTIFLEEKKISESNHSSAYEITRNHLGPEFAQYDD